MFPGSIADIDIRNIYSQYLVHIKLELSCVLEAYASGTQENQRLVDTRYQSYISP